MAHGGRFWTPSGTANHLMLETHRMEVTGAGELQALLDAAILGVTAEVGPHDIRQARLPQVYSRP